MSKSYKIITKQILVASIVANLSIAPAFSIDNIQLRGSVNDSAPAIQLRNTIKIDKKGRTISLNLRDSDVKQVLRMLADKAGLNIVFHDSVSGKATLDLVNVSLDKAFEYVMTLNGLTYWQDNKTLIIASKNAAQGLGINRTEIKPIKIKYGDAPMIADFLNNNVFSYNRPDISSANIAVANSGTNEVIIFGNNNDVILAQKVIGYLDVKPSVKTFTINHGDISDISNKICKIAFSPSLSNNSNSTGNGSTQSTPMNNGTTIPTENKDLPTGSIVFCNSTVNASTQNQNTTQQQQSSGSNNQTFNGITSTLKSLITPAFWVSGDYQLNQITVYGGTEEQVKIAEDVVKKFDKKPPQAYMEISIVELTQRGSKELSNNWYGLTGSTAYKFDGEGSRYEFGSSKLSDSYLDGVKGANNILKNLTDYGDGRRTIVGAVQALIEQHKGKMLANPRIIATHGKTSTINISQDYVKTRKQETNASSGQDTIVSTNYEIADQGIKLDITPKISPDGYISVDIKPSYTSIKEPVTENNNLVATLLNKRDLELKNVRIKDGETLVLGGLIQEDNSNKVFKIPVLGDLPIVGAFFKSTTTEQSRNELILMITPKIIKDEGTVENI